MKKMAFIFSLLLGLVSYFCFDSMPSEKENADGWVILYWFGMISGFISLLTGLVFIQFFSAIKRLIA